MCVCLHRAFVENGHDFEANHSLACGAHLDEYQSLWEEEDGKAYADIGVSKKVGTI